jgi:hypothetical protein
MKSLKQLYDEGGFREVGRGIRDFFYYRSRVHILLSQLLRKTGYDIPYYVQRHIREATEEMNKLSQKGIGPRITDFPLSDHKTSDTLFIMGSGSSINDISDKQWDHIKEHDSVGFNKWPVHDHIPTYHVFEIRIEEENKENRDKYWKLLNKRKKEYQNIPIILKDTAAVSDKMEPHHLPEWLVGAVIISCDTNFDRAAPLNGNAEQNKRVLKYLKEKGHFDQNININILYRKRGTVSYLIHFGVVLGYENIVLCGIDMVDSRYFFNQKDDNHIGDRVNVPSNLVPVDFEGSSSNQEDSVHATNDPSVSPLTLEKVIYSMNDIVLKELGVNLYVENTKSALHPKIPLYEYE